jgi:hypothetical protein
MPPPKPAINIPDIPEEGEWGSGLEHGYFSTHGELFDYAEPTADELAYFHMNDGQAQAIALAYALPILGAQGGIEEGPDDKGEAERIRDNLMRSQFLGGMTTPMGQVIAQMTSAFPNKRAFFEKDIKYFDDGFVGYKKLAFRPVWQCTVRGDETGSYNGYVQRGFRSTGQGFTEIFEPEKTFTYIHRNHMRPLEGVSIFQTAYQNYVDKLRIKRLHNIHLQNFSLGTVIGSYSGQEGRPAMTRFFSKLRKFKGGGGTMVLGEGEAVDFKSGTGAGSEFLAAIEHLDAEMARSCLTQFLVLGQGGNSSVWNLSRDQSDFFLMCLEAELRDIEEAITNYIIAPLVRWNWGDEASFPVWAFEPLSDVDKQKALDIWSALVVAATRPTGPLWDALQDKALQGLGIDPGKMEKDVQVATTGVPAPDWGEAHKELLKTLRNGGAEPMAGEQSQATQTAPTGQPNMPVAGQPAATTGTTPRATPAATPRGTHGNPNGRTSPR